MITKLDDKFIFVDCVNVIEENIKDGKYYSECGEYHVDVSHFHGCKWLVYLNEDEQNLEKFDIVLFKTDDDRMKYYEEYLYLKKSIDRLLKLNRILK